MQCCVMKGNPTQKKEAEPIIVILLYLSLFVTYNSGITASDLICYLTAGPGPFP